VRGGDPGRVDAGRVGVEGGALVVGDHRCRGRPGRRGEQGAVEDLAFFVVSLPGVMPTVAVPAEASAHLAACGENFKAIDR
jgi:hypothetical protein